MKRFISGSVLLLGGTGWALASFNHGASETAMSFIYTGLGSASLILFVLAYPLVMLIVKTRKDYYKAGVVGMVVGMATLYLSVMMAVIALIYWLYG